MALTDTVRLILTADDQSAPAFRGFLANVDRARLATDSLSASMVGLSRASSGVTFVGAVAGMDALRVASNAATRAIVDQMAAIAALNRMSVVSGAAAPVLGAAPTMRNSVSGAAVRSETSALSRGGRVLQTGIATEAGLGGRVASAVFGPEGLIAGAILYGGYKAVQASNQFYSALAGTGAATNTGYGAIQPIGRAALASGASGTAQYSPTQTVLGSQQFLAAGNSPATTGAILDYISKGSAVLKLPDLTLLATGVTDLADTYGKGNQTSIKAFKAFADMTVAADQFAKANPGALVANFAKILPTAKQAGITAPEALAYVIKETQSGETTRFSATNFAAFIRTSLVKPTLQSQTAADQLGIEVGPHALADYGGFTNFLKVVTSIGKTADPTVFAKFAGTTNALRGLTELSQGQGMGRVDQLTAGLTASPGTIPRGFNTLMQGPDQQWKGIANEFNADMIKAGKTLSDTLNPDLLLLASSSLKAAEGIGGLLGTIGSLLDELSRHAQVPSVPGQVGSFLDQHLGGLAGTVKGGIIGAALGPFGLLGGAVVGGASSIAGGIGHLLGGVGATMPPLPAGIFATHGGYENRQTGQWYQTLPAATANPSLNPANLALGGGDPRIVAAIQLGAGAGVAHAVASGRAVPVSITDRETGLLGSSQYASGQRLLGVRARYQSYQQLQGGAKEATGAYSELLALMKSGAAPGAVNAQLGTVLTDLHATLVLGANPGAVSKLGAQAKGAVGQYDYTAARSLFDLGIKENLSPQALAPLLKGVVATIPGLGKSPAEQQYLTYSVTSQATKLANTQMLQASTYQLQAAQIFGDSVRIHHGTIPQQTAAAQNIYAASMALIGVETRTGKLKGLGITDAQNRAQDTLGTTLNGLAGQQLGIDQSHMALLQAQGKTGAAKAFIDTILKDERATGINQYQIALDKLTLTKGLQGPILPGPQLIRPNLPGLGTLAAGFGASVAKLDGGGQDSAAQMLRTMQAQLARAETTIRNQAAEIAELRKHSSSLDKIERNTRTEIKSKPAQAVNLDHMRAS